MKTHFDVFGLTPRFALDLPALEKRYRELSLKTHPDRSGQAPPERLRALEETTALNEAYKVLRDPIRRAFYLLKLHGVDLDREDAGAHRDLPLDFLEEVIALRETLDSAKKSNDLHKAQQMGREVESFRLKALNEATGALASLESEPQNTHALREASHQLARVRYFTRFLEDLQAFEEESL